MKLYDATLAIHEKMVIFPGDPPFIRTTSISLKTVRVIWWNARCVWWELIIFQLNTMRIRAHPSTTFY